MKETQEIQLVGMLKEMLSSFNEFTTDQVVV